MMTSPEILARRIRRWEEHPEAETAPSAEMGRRLLAGETLTSTVGLEYGLTEGAFSMVVRDMKKAGYTFRKTKPEGGNRIYWTLARRPTFDFDLELEPPPRPVPSGQYPQIRNGAEAEPPRRIVPGELGVGRREVTWGSYQAVREVHHRGRADFERADKEAREAVIPWHHPALGETLEVRALALTDDGVLVQMVGGGGAWQAIVTGHVPPGQ